MKKAAARHDDVELIGGAVDQQAVFTALAQWLEVRQQRGAKADQHGDDDADRHRATVELQRIVEHARVAAHDRVLDAAEQEAPPADLDLGGESKACHVSVADVQSCVDAVDRRGHVLATDLTELLDVEGVEVHRARQAHVASLLAGLH